MPAVQSHLCPSGLSGGGDDTCAALSFLPTNEIKLINISPCSVSINSARSPGQPLSPASPAVLVHQYLSGIVSLTAWALSLQQIFFIRPMQEMDFTTEQTQAGLWCRAGPTFLSVLWLLRAAWGWETPQIPQQFHRESFPAWNHLNRKPGSDLMRKTCEKIFSFSSLPC